ncbi:S8 family serine peptidase [Methylobacterium sp. 1030]|uniref:S8 family peptidase n=1 Tax=Methylobacterium sp. 1030 TaxID=3156404 RepID=UPI00339908B6
MTRYVMLRGSAAVASANSSRRTRGDSAAIDDLDISVDDLRDRDIADLQRDPDIVAACPTMPITLIKPYRSESGKSGTNWGITAVKADQSAHTGAGVTVAVLDTGIDAKHPAFTGVKILEEDFSGSGNGDRNGHGTHCAGTIFGRDVSFRIGVARGITTAFIGKVLKDDGRGSSEALFNGLSWAMRNRANIISMSVGFDYPGMVASLVEKKWPVELATSKALEAYRGNLRLFDALMRVNKAQENFSASSLVIAAAGNESQRNTKPDYRIAASLPAAADDVVSVAAIGRKDDKFDVADFSNSLATVAGPGVDILSAEIGGGLVSLSGTSMACPHVAGVAALWWEALGKRRTQANPSNVRANLITSAQEGVFVAGLDAADVGQGLVSAPTDK